MTWFVDFNSMNRTTGVFADVPETPGRQGGHMTVIEDYQVSNVPGFGTLKAGTVVTDPAALKAALDPAATIDFIRIKNSWGTQRPDPLGIGRGYYDLYMEYLDGPIKHCEQKDGHSTDDCYDETPLNEFVLPAGY